MLPTFEAAAFEPRSPAAAYLERLLLQEMAGIEIVSIARRPGVQSKVAVRGRGPSGDAVARVREKLDGELIQVVTWSADARRYVAEALGLAQVPPIVLKPVIGHAEVFVGEIDLRGMNGWRGINRVLASMLTGWRIRLTSVATTQAWRELHTAMAQQRPLPAALLTPTTVEISGLFATLMARSQHAIGQEISVRVIRMDADEGRIFVNDRLRSRSQLALPLRS